MDVVKETRFVTVSTVVVVKSSIDVVEKLLVSVTVKVVGLGTMVGI